MPAHVQEWIKGGMSTLDLYIAGSSLVGNAEETVDDGRIKVDDFKLDEDGGFSKLATQHAVHVADILNADQVQEIITTTPHKCTGAIVHLARGSPSTEFNHNQLVILFRHMQLFAADHIAFLVCFFFFSL